MIGYVINSSTELQHSKYFVVRKNQDVCV